MKSNSIIDLTVQCAPPGAGDGWRYEVDGVSVFTEADADAVRDHLASRGDRLRAPYVRPTSRQHDRAVPASLVLGYLIGLVTGAAFAILLVRVGATWGAR